MGCKSSKASAEADAPDLRFTADLCDPAFSDRARPDGDALPPGWKAVRHATAHGNYYYTYTDGRPGTGKIYSLVAAWKAYEDVRGHEEDAGNEETYELTVCVVCGSAEDSEQLLLCDSTGCDAAYHTHCLRSPLEEVPEGEWFCELARRRESNRRSSPKHLRPTSARAHAHLTRFVAVLFVV